MTARLAARPGMRELLLFGVAYLLYSLGRFVAIGDVDTAHDNAHSIVDSSRRWSSTSSRACRTRSTAPGCSGLLNHLYLAAQLVVVRAR